MYIVGITGASGSVIGIRLIEELLRSGRHVSAIVSDSGWRTLGHELFRRQKNPSSVAEVLDARSFTFDRGLLSEYANNDFFAEYQYHMWEGDAGDAIDDGHGLFFGLVHQFK